MGYKYGDWKTINQGEDGIKGEIMKMLDKDSFTDKHSLIAYILGKRRITENLECCSNLPNSWEDDPHICDNYKGIALLYVAYKELSYCILGRIKPIAEEMLGDYQGGFRHNRSTTDQIFSLRQIMEKLLEFNKSVCVLFVNFKNPTILSIDIVFLTERRWAVTNTV